MIPVARPDIDDAEIAAVTEVLRSGMLAGGRRVAELEERWSSYIGVKHTIAVSNGTVALMCVFAGLGIGPGDEVITVGHTFNATVSSILYTGARPVFVDIEPTTYVMDPELIEAAITPRTRAICPVHLFGLPADMAAIGAIAERHGLTVVEDACQAHGATVDGRRVGSFGHGTFSLYGTKNMTTGEGGLITTNDNNLADWIRLYRNQGMRERYRHEMLGYNFRLTDIAAAIGLCQLDKLERNTERRRAIAARYDEALAGMPIGVPVTPAGRTHVFHQYTINVGPSRDADRGESGRGRCRHGHLLPGARPPPALCDRARDRRGPPGDRPGRRDVAVAADVPGSSRRRAGRRHRGDPGCCGSYPNRRPVREDLMAADWSPVGDREVRVGLIGLGMMGRNHLRVLGERPGVRLAAVADPLAAALAAATENSGAQGYLEPLAMLGEAELDAVVIASPTTTHLPLALSAIDRGIAVLVEKPLAATPDEADQIVIASAGSGVPVQVGHVERFNPAVLELGRLLDAGWLSTVYAITSRRGGPLPARIRDVGVTIDLATHDVDILSWVAAERPVRVTAETAQRVHQDHEDLLFGLMRFPSGTVAMLDVDWLTPTKRRTLTVLGEEGMFELDYLSQRLTFTRGTDVTTPELISGYAPTFVGETVDLPVDDGEPLAAEIDAFIEVVRHGGRPIVAAEDGRWAVVLADALIRAARERRTVELDEVPAR